MTMTSTEQTALTVEQGEQVAGYVVVNAEEIGDGSGWMTPRMRATAEQAEADRDYWQEATRTTGMDLRVAKLVLLEEAVG
ncbi:hypothetical protein ACWCSD_31925 [Nonomuraea sp. NPDC001684]